MKLPIRLENAITKLYTAFHEDELSAQDCSKCAVGNICDNNDNWAIMVYHHKNREFIMNNYNIPEVKKVIDNTGYSASEILNVETLFLKETYEEETKETQFKGLCAVVEYLCELDNIPNVMDYTKLFETEKEKPKYQLTNQLN